MPGSRTPLYPSHLDAGAKIVDFGGWDMPLHYGSQLEEHHAVRRDAGIFDVSHMTVVDISGPKSRDFLRHLLANDIAKLETPGRALYGCMLDEEGGILDDLITYFLGEDRYRLVVNAATREKDLGWIQYQAEDLEVSVVERDDLAMVAVQGPEARSKAGVCLPEDLRGPAADLKPFQAAWSEDWFVARTGYTGEDGWEVVMPAEAAAGFWKAALAAGIRPAGLGARDTLRLEAGLCLYGQDMDESTTPYESALGWTVALEPADRHFVGRAALEAQKEAGVPRRLVGLLLEGRGIMRPHQKVYAAAGEGAVTSGTWSPTLERSIGFARVPAGTGDTVEVEVRGKRLTARVTKLCFVRKGEPQIEI